MRARTLLVAVVGLIATASAVQGQVGERDVQLLDAAIEGDRARVVALLKAGADVNAKDPARDESEGTPLIYAALYGHVDVVRALLEARALRLDAQDKNGITPLMAAVASRSAEVAALLLRAKAGLEIRATGGETALLMGLRTSATRGPRPSPVIPLLLAAGANVAAKDDYGRTTIMNAAFGGDLEAVRAVLKAGADLHAVSAEGATALLDAAAQGHAEIVQVLMDAGADVKVRARDGRTALILAAESEGMFAEADGPARTVQVLLAAGADPHARGKDGKTALERALEEGRVEVAAVLKKGGVVESSSPGRELVAAAGKGELERVRALLAAGADVDAREGMPDEHTGGKKMTALMRAAARGHAEVAGALIAARADVNARDESRRTALIYAASWCPREKAATIGRLLLEARADANAVDLSNSTGLLTAARYGREPLVLLLLQAKTDLSVTDTNGDTALICAAMDGHDGIVKALIQAGSDVRVRNTNGRNALMGAVARGSVESVRALLQAGADVNGADTQGGTALQWATQNNRAEIVRLLRDAGARE